MSPHKKKRVGASPDLFASLTVNGRALASMPKEQLSALVLAWDTYIDRLSRRPQGGGCPDEETLGLISLVRLRRALASLYLGDYPRLFSDTDWVLAQRTQPREVNTAHLIRAQGFEGTAQYEQAIGEWDYVIAACEQVKAAPAGQAGVLDLLAELYVNRAILAGELERYQQVVLDCDRAEPLHAACARLFSVRGLALGRLGQAERALSDCNRSVELDAGDPDCYYRRALLLVSSGRLEEAFNDFGRALELDPSAAYIARARDEATLTFLGTLLRQADALFASRPKG